jgi:uncharacterized protein YciI
MAFLAVRRYAKPREELTTDMALFWPWLERQHRAGKIVLSGPTADRVAGIFLIIAADRAEAEAIAASDPYHQAGETTFDLYEWEIHQFFGNGAFSDAAIRATDR